MATASRPDRLIGLVLGALLLAAPAVGKADGEASLALPDMPLHDPWIVADKGSKTYYLFTRNEAAMTGDRRLGIMVYASYDLKSWNKPRLAFVLPDGTWAKGGSWAPEVHPWRGRYYLFATYHDEAARLASVGNRRPYVRATMLAVADAVDGPYKPVRNGATIVPRDQMTLDGTLYVDRLGKPWLVYAHEWMQTTVGTIEAMPLTDDLAAAGPSKVLFRADEATWAVGQKQPDGDLAYVTDGPELFRSRDDSLLMLWSSYGKAGYVQALARSRSGEIEGPWEQLGPLVERDSGHGMLFKTFEDNLMMVVHRPFKRARGKLYEMRDDGNRVTVVREATELDGETCPTHHRSKARIVDHVECQHALAFMGC